MNAVIPLLAHCIPLKLKVSRETRCKSLVGPKAYTYEMIRSLIIFSEPSNLYTG